MQRLALDVIKKVGLTVLNSRISFFSWLRYRDWVTLSDENGCLISSELFERYPYADLKFEPDQERLFNRLKEVRKQYQDAYIWQQWWLLLMSHLAIYLKLYELMVLSRLQEKTKRNIQEGRCYYEENVSKPSWLQRMVQHWRAQLYELFNKVGDEESLTEDEPVIPFHTALNVPDEAEALELRLIEELKCMMNLPTRDLVAVIDLYQHLRNTCLNINPERLKTVNNLVSLYVHPDKNTAQIELATAQFKRFVELREQSHNAMSIECIVQNITDRLRQQREWYEETARETLQRINMREKLILKLEQIAQESEQKAQEKLSELEQKAQEKLSELEQKAQEKQSELEQKAQEKQSELEQKAQEKQSELEQKAQEKQSELEQKAQEKLSKLDRKIQFLECQIQVLINSHGNNPHSFFSDSQASEMGMSNMGATPDGLPRQRESSI